MHCFTESDVMIGDMGEASFSKYNIQFYNVFYNLFYAYFQLYYTKL